MALNLDQIVEYNGKEYVVAMISTASDQEPTYTIISKDCYVIFRMCGMYTADSEFSPYETSNDLVEIRDKDSNVVGYANLRESDLKVLVGKVVKFDSSIYDDSSTFL